MIVSTQMISSQRQKSTHTHTRTRHFSYFDSYFKIIPFICTHEHIWAHQTHRSPSKCKFEYSDFDVLFWIGINSYFCILYEMIADRSGNVESVFVCVWKFPSCHWGCECVCFYHCECVCVRYVLKFYAADCCCSGWNVFGMHQLVFVVFTSTGKCCWQQPNYFTFWPMQFVPIAAWESNILIVLIPKSLKTNITKILTFAWYFCIWHFSNIERFIVVAVTASGNIGTFQLRIMLRCTRECV